MNSIEDQCSGDSSYSYSHSNIISTITEYLPVFHPEPGTSLANAIGEQMSPINSNEIIQPISSILSNTESNNDSERQSLNETENLKYKTELCRNFSAYGFCSYSSRCQFAHGLQELRCRTRHPKYKTEICRNFLSGYCKYASRCQFLHNSDETKDSTQTNNNSSTSSTVTYPTAAAIGTYLFTNMLAQSAVYGLGGPIAHQSALAALAACTNFNSKSNITSTIPSVVPIESSLRRTTIPVNCGIEMQQISPLHLSPNIFHGISIPQNQNNNDSQLSTSYLQSATHCQSQSCTNQTIDILSEDNIQIEKMNNNIKRIRKSSAHI